MTTNQTIDGVPRELLQDLCYGLRITQERAIKELRALLDTPEPCAHEWTDDGGHLLVCTACGAQEDHDPGWRDMAAAPTDGTMLRLLVEFEDHSTEDAEQAPTIGANNCDNDGEDVWRFAGWCWSHDHFTEGKGTPVGWLPMLDDPVSTPAAQTRGEPVCKRCGDSGVIDDKEKDELPSGHYVEKGLVSCPECEESGEPVACMPVERCYDVRAKMIIAFNEAKKAGGDLDDALDAAYKSALRHSPNPMSAEHPAPVAVVLPEREHVHSKTLPFRNPAIGDGYISGWNACLDEVTRLNTK